MRVRPLVHAVLSSRRRTIHVLAATATVATAGVLTPILLGATDASAELATTATSPGLIQVAVSAPATVTRGASTELQAKVTSAADTPVPAGTVQFVSRAPGAAAWQPFATATTGVDGTTTLPVQAVDTATEYGAYLSAAGGAAASQTGSTTVHVIDLQPRVPGVVRYNARVTLAGHLLQDASQGLAGQRVQVRFRPRAGAGWSRARWTTTNTAGVAALAGRFTRSLQVGIQFLGADGLAASPLRVATVKVKPKAATSHSGFRFPLLNPAMATSPGSWSLDQGVDMFASGEACGAAAKLVAVGDGTVIQTGISGFGPTAPVIRMSSGPFAGRNVYYGHTGHIYVHVGQVVHAGQLVAQIGCGRVGYSSAPHLEIGVGVPGGPPCCPAFGQTARSMYRELVAALRSA